MKPVADNKGRPLLALSTLLAAWVGVRMVMLDYGLFAPPIEPQATGGPIQDMPLTKSARPHVLQGISTAPATMTPRGEPLAPVPFAAMPQRPALPRAHSLRTGADRETSVSTTLAVGHHMLWMAALARMPVPVMLVGDLTASRVPAPFYPAEGDRSTGNRWSADSWLMLRHGGGKPLATGAAPTTYGASQTGAVIRYRLNGADTRNPTVYLRGTAALDSIRDKEAALGFSARPIPAIPVIAALELRVSDLQSGTYVRPAAMAVTELAPVDLPHGTRAEFYAQAGYVGGKYATAFVDGQARVDKHVAAVGTGEIRAGAGAWAGAQKGASRIDIGPTAAMGISLGDKGFARLGVDWRLRIGGDAVPNSGPAVTLSAGF